MTDTTTAEYQAYLIDQINDTVGAGLDDKYLDYLCKALQPGLDYHSMKILDVGPSKFLSWDYFREHYQNDITGIDIGRDGLEYCRERNKTGMIEQDAHTMNERFEAESFDFCISFHAIEHLLDVPQVLRNIFYVLKPGSKFYFSLPCPAPKRDRGHVYEIMSIEAMLQLCKDAGFNKVLHSELVSDLRFRPEQEMICLVQK